MPTLSSPSQLVELLKHPSQLERIAVDLTEQVVLLGVYYFRKLLFSIVVVPWITYQLSTGVLRGSNRWEFFGKITGLFPGFKERRC
ncbi:MAG: hypothetical protein ABGW77_01725 [Campylobacterales bacterium]